MSNSREPINQSLTAKSTSIPGLFEFQLDVRGANRGWWQREKAATEAKYREAGEKTVKETEK